jgi:TPR repeat protein
MRRILAGLVLILMLTGGVAAGPFEDGGAALKRGDYAEALRLWRPLADQGHADGQLKLGNIYGRGQGVQRDYAEAVKWYRLAAEQGNALAQFNLGIMYRRGLGGERRAGWRFGGVLPPCPLWDPSLGIGGSPSSALVTSKSVAVLGCCGEGREAGCIDVCFPPGSGHGHCP